MSEWKKVKLGDVSQYVNDKIAITATNESYYVSTDSMLKDRGGIIAPESIPSDGNVTKYQSDDILVSNIRPYFKKIWFSCREGGCSNDVLVFRALEGITSRYLYYILSDDTFFEHMMAGANGTKMPRGNKKLILNYSFELPSLPTQHRIATILSRYDSLIENYQKQIKLLEEAAQRLYKEWFVDLHFPSHENTKIIDGVPEGWEKKTLDEFCSVFTGKKNANAAAQSGKYKFFTCGDTPLQIDSYIYDGPAIIISGNGSYTGRTTFYEGKFDLYQRTYACTIINNENRDLIYGLFEIVKCELTTQISGGTHGAAIPYIVMGDITKFTFTSNDIVLRKFSKIIKSFLDRTMCISSQIRLLTEARDRLLPKLMSGELKV